MSVARRVFDSTGAYFYEQYINFISHFTFSIEGIDEEDDFKLKVNTFLGQLYCIELSTSGNIQEILSKDALNKIFSSYGNADNSFVIWALLKKKRYQKNYIFSHNKDLLDLIRKDLDAHFIDAVEMSEAINDLYLNNRYNYTGMVKNRENPIFTEEMNFDKWQFQSRRLFREAAYKNFLKTRVYYAKQYLMNKHQSEERYSKIRNVFQSDFSGAFFSFINFSKKDAHQWVRRRADKFMDESPSEIRDLMDDLERGVLDAGIVNSVLFLEDEENNQDKSRNKAAAIGTALNMVFEEKNAGATTLLQKTPLHTRDLELDLLVPKDEFLQGYIGLCHKADVSNPDFDGTDVNGAHWNTNLGNPTDYHENKTASTLFLGLTGTGKTTSENGMFSKILRYCLEENIIEQDIFDKRHLRVFDIKKSGLKLAKNIASTGAVNVDFIKTNAEDFRFNLLNIPFLIDKNGKKVLSGDGIALHAYLVSFILEAINSEDEKVGLNSDETRIFIKGVKEIYETNAYTPMPLEYLKDINKTTFDKLVKLGYDPLLDSVADIKEEEFSYLNKPTLGDLVTLLRVRSATTDKINAKDTKSLLKKLSTIQETTPAFASIDDVDYANSKYTHIDFDGVGTKNPLYVPVFIANLLRVFNADCKSQEELDAKGIDRPTIYYHFSEASNIFSCDTFKPFIKKIDNEARSFGIRAIWSTQNADEIPAFMREQIGNTITLLPSQGKKREAVITTLKRLYSLDEAQERLLRDAQEYNLAIFTEHNMSVVDLNLTPREIKEYGQSGKEQMSA